MNEMVRGLSEILCSPNRNDSTKHIGTACGNSNGQKLFIALLMQNEAGTLSARKYVCIYFL